MQLQDRLFPLLMIEFVILIFYEIGWISFNEFYLINMF